MTKQLLVQDGSGRRFSYMGDLDDEGFAARGWTVIEDDLAVTRPRKKRTKADMAKLVKDGVVRDPAAPPEPSLYGDGPDLEARPGVFIVRPPGAAISGESEGK